jgi:hypothetical protein
MSGQTQLLKNAFLRLGKPALSYYDGLKKHRGAAAGYHLQRILTYVDRHGSDVVTGAMAHGRSYEILHKPYRQLELAEKLHDLMTEAPDTKEPDN